MNAYVRRRAWEALRRDDPQELARVVCTRDRFVQASTALWNPSKKTGVRKRSIPEVIDIAVPPYGAPRCLRWCLFEHGNAVPRDVRERIAALGLAHPVHVRHAVERRVHRRLERRPDPPHGTGRRSP